MEQNLNISDSILPTLKENDLRKKLFLMFEINIPTCCNNHNLGLILFEKFICLPEIIKKNPFKLLGTIVIKSIILQKFYSHNLS